MMRLVPLPEEEEIFFSPLACEDIVKAAICKPGRFFTRNQIDQHLDLGLPSLQNFQKVKFL